MGRNVRGRGGDDPAMNNRQKIIEATNVHDSAIQSNTHKSIEYLLETIPTNDDLRYYPDRDVFKYDHSYCIKIMDIYAGIITVSSLSSIRC